MCTLNSAETHAVGLLPNAPPDEVAAGGSSDPPRTPHTPGSGLSGQIFSYVSAVRLARSSRARWEATHAAARMLWDDADTLSVTVEHLEVLFGMLDRELEQSKPALALTSS